MSTAIKMNAYSKGSVHGAPEGNVVNIALDGFLISITLQAPIKVAIYRTKNAKPTLTTAKLLSSLSMFSNTSFHVEDPDKFSLLKNLGPNYNEINVVASEMEIEEVEENVINDTVQAEAVAAMCRM